ncbi:hypothetical protein [Enterococcus sp. LJL51]|uniref:hypothetical protein n=1 Tax=Enterococcus sp. LJL51 TaxID=3416656 RepID=UPI003CF6F7D6
MKKTQNLYPFIISNRTLQVTALLISLLLFSSCSSSKDVPSLSTNSRSQQEMMSSSTAKSSARESKTQSSKSGTIEKTSETQNNASHSQETTETSTSTKESLSPESVALENYYDLDMPIKVLLAMSTASYTDGGGNIILAEDFETYIDIHQYSYRLNGSILEVAQQEQGGIHFYRFETAGDTIEPLFHTVMITMGPERGAPGEWDSMNPNPTKKTVLYKNYLENQDLYNHLIEKASPDENIW